MFVRLEITKVFEAKSLTKLTRNKNTIKGVKNTFVLCTLKSVMIKGVRIKIAPSFAKNALKKSTKKHKKNIESCAT